MPARTHTATLFKLSFRLWFLNRSIYLRCQWMCKRYWLLCLASYDERPRHKSVLSNSIKSKRTKRTEQRRKMKTNLIWKWSWRFCADDHFEWARKRVNIWMWIVFDSKQFFENEKKRGKYPTFSPECKYLCYSSSWLVYPPPTACHNAYDIINCMDCHL